ncbi:uncharacterized protein LOC132195735 [Neocloeon triangulifer]|uniref:uncharacterized protein LOC132195735 n=1 Tax=Neocloeon triangulifer TaxID=2078957 RepID=UPI00286F624F|nr:uncharacterized protein LOC132195735 [Neocloeon triangulifer]
MAPTWLVVMVLAFAANASAQFFCPPSEVLCSVNRRSYSRCPDSGAVSGCLPAAPSCNADSYCFEGYNGPRGPCIPILCMVPTNDGPVGVPQACGFYYTCSNNTALTLTISKCPIGKHFNSRTKVCDEPHLAGCDPTISTTTVTTTSSIPIGTKTSTTPTTTTTTASPINIKTSSRPRSTTKKNNIISGDEDSSEENLKVSPKFSKLYKFFFL